MKANKFISAADQVRIKDVVRQAESVTSGEIVPVIVECSSRYDWIGYRGALLGWGVATLISLWMHFQRPFVLEFWETQALQIFGMFSGWAIIRLPFALRWLIPENLLFAEVHAAAQRAFLKYNLIDTRDRTGVLIFISLREHRVEVLADKGIHEKVGEHFWKHEVERMIHSIREGKPADGLIDAIRSIGEKLSAHFPRRPDDSNELSDGVRFEKTIS